MDDIISSLNDFIQSSRNTEVRYDMESASSRSLPGEGFEAWVVAEDFCFCCAADYEADVVVELEGFLEDGEAAETGGAGENNCFDRHDCKGKMCVVKSKYGCKE